MPTLRLSAALVILGLTGATAAAQEPARLDLFGDPLPAAAVARMGTARLRHDYAQNGRVLSAAFSPDGKTLVTGGGDHTVRLWEVETGKQLGRFAAEHAPDSVSFGPDKGSLLVVLKSMSLMRHVVDVQVWDAATAKQRRSLTEPWTCGTAAISADHQRVAVTWADKNGIRVLEAATGKVLHTLAADNDPQDALVFSGDGQTLAAVGPSYKGGVTVWDVASGKKLCTLKTITHKLVLSHDGTSVIAAHPTSHGLAVWDTGTGKELRQIGDKPLPAPADPKQPGKEPKPDKGGFSGEGFAGGGGFGGGQGLAGPIGDPNVIALSPDGKTLACNAGPGYWDSAIYLWDVATAKSLGKIETRDPAFRGLVFSPDGKTLLTWHAGAVRLWDVAARREKFAAAAHCMEISALAFSPDGKHVASGSFDASVRVWEVATGAEVHRLAGQRWLIHENPVNTIAYAPDGKTLVAGVWGDRILHGWDPATGKAIPLKIGGHGGDVIYRDGRPALFHAEYSSDGKYLLTAGRDDTARLWDVKAGKEIRVWDKLLPDEIATEPPSPWQFTAEGNALLVGNRDAVQFQDPATGKVLSKHSLPTQRKDRWMLLSPDGKRLLAYDENHRYELWDLPTGNRHHTLDLDWQQVSCLCFAPDGRSLAVGLRDGGLVLVETMTGKVRARQPGCQGSIWVLAFSTDSRHLASGAADTTVVVWDVVRMARP
jgi:WD40 repeat protein